MNLAGVPKAILGLVLGAVLPLGIDYQSVFAFDEAVPTTTGSQPSVHSLDQALVDITSEEVGVRNAAAALLIERGDATLIPKLDGIRAEGSRAV
ncbi:MAG: hypothetical protein HP491_15420, partial [Nitrospira sp.]|nr:hypothetical protein [Nitrospira sp.]MBH0181059.1 hypothetical protein [Nitrospira sp.]MBH0186308.1 hypothetical protein [Nitrospira sp.]